MAAETPRQIANAHTVFNVTNTLIFIGFPALLARLVERLVPDGRSPRRRAVRARYLDATADRDAVARARPGHHYQAEISR